jgi:maleylacetoacetate isomerase
MVRYRLYGYFRSSATYRVRVALRLKGLAFDIEPIHLVKDGGQQYSDVYQALNPMGEVPALAVHPSGDTTDGTPTAVLAQSVAVLEFLEESHPTPALLPSDPVDRAKVRQLVECVNSSIQPVQNLKVLRRLTEVHGLDVPTRTAWGKYWIDRGFAGLEQLVAASAGTYAFGDSVTLADVVLVPQVYNAERFGCDMALYPTIARVAAAARALEAFKAGAPEVQPDTPPDLRP